MDVDDVVVLVDDVLDVVDVVDVVDVDGGVVEVVVAGLMVVTGAAATAFALELSSPHAASTSNAAHATAIDSRRMTQSAIENQRCNSTPTASWPERTHAGMPIPW